MYKLVIGNKNYSSWSLRAWLYLRESRIPFEEIRIPLFQDNWKERIAAFSSAGRVPVLIDGDVAVWDTLAIMDYVAESEPDAVGWPEDRAHRAHARSISAEMHSGFLAVREWLPQNIRARTPVAVSEMPPELVEQIGRVQEIWTDCRERYAAAGPWLFGRLCIADIMFAPVALRFVSYSVALEGRCAEFVDAIQGLESIQEWARDAASESEAIDFIDSRVGTDGVPMTLG